MFKKNQIFNLIELVDFLSVFIRNIVFSISKLIILVLSVMKSRVHNLAVTEF